VEEETRHPHHTRDESSVTDPLAAKTDNTVRLVDRHLGLWGKEHRIDVVTLCCGRRRRRSAGGAAQWLGFRV